MLILTSLRHQPGGGVAWGYPALDSSCRRRHDLARLQRVNRGGFWRYRRHGEELEPLTAEQQIAQQLFGRLDCPQRLAQAVAVALRQSVCRDRIRGGRAVVDIGDLLRED